MTTKNKQLNLNTRAGAEAWLLDKMDRMSKGEQGHEVITLTKPLSDVLLENNKDNRRLRETRVDTIYGDIMYDRWQRNGQPVILADTGDLNDGQHRLTAQSRADKPIQIDLVWGVPRDTRMTVDITAARTPGDMIRMGNNSVNAVSLAAVSRQVIGYETFGALTQLSRISTALVVQRATSDSDMQLATSWGVSAPRDFLQMVSATTAGAAYYILSKHDSVRGPTFMKHFRDGEHLSKDSPIYKLRQRLSVERKLSPNMKMELILNSWNLWLQDKKAKQIHLIGKLPTLFTADMLKTAEEKAKG